MSPKSTAVAPANIAFVKYWGTRDEQRTLPYNPSLSMTLRSCVSRTTAEWRPEGQGDEISVRVAGGALEPAERGFSRGVERHLERLRAWAGVAGSFRIATENNFPTGAGIASSASGFAALTLAVSAALDRVLSGSDLSRLARLSGSGSAARSALGGYVEWPAGEGEAEGHAIQLAGADHWNLRDLIVVVDEGIKPVSSREGHRLAPTSPYFEPRLRLLPERLKRVRDAIRDRRFDRLAPVVEEEAIDLHLVAMSSRPPIFYWQGATLRVLELARRLRGEGLEVCATMDAGPNVHLICTPEAEKEVAAELKGLDGVKGVIPDGVGPGPALTSDHLF